MKKRNIFIFLLLIVFIPLAGLSSSAFFKKHFENNFYQSISEQFKNLPQESRKKIILPEKVCSSAANKKVFICDLLDKNNSLKKISMWGIGLGWGLLLLASAAAFFAGSHPVRIAFTFPWLIRIAGILLGVLLAIDITIFILVKAFYMNVFFKSIMVIKIYELTIPIIFIMLITASMIFSCTKKKKLAVDEAGFKLKIQKSLNKKEKIFTHFWRIYTNVLDHIQILSFNSHETCKNGRTLLFYPVRLLLEYCVWLYSKGIERSLKNFNLSKTLTLGRSEHLNETKMLDL